MKKSTKNLLILGIITINSLILIVSAKEVNAQTSTPCYQSMAYCSAYAINLSCQKTPTAHLCSSYVCESCGLNTIPKPEN